MSRRVRASTYSGYRVYQAVKAVEGAWTLLGDSYYIFPMPKVKCPHCESPALSVGLTDGYKFYCSRCGWNHSIVEVELSSAIRVHLILLCLALLLVVVARLKSPGEWRVWAGIILAFSALPMYYALSSFLQLRRLRSFSFESAPDQSRTFNISEMSSSGIPTKTIAIKEKEFPELATLQRPRKLRMTWKGRLYLTLTLTLVSLFTAYGVPALWSEFRNRQTSHGRQWSLLLPIVLIYGCSVAFFRNRIRERQLLANGELTSGYVTAQNNGRYTQSVQYCFKLPSGRLAFGSCNDASRSVYEGMTVPVFYDADNPTRSIPHDCSLTKIA